MEQQADLPGFWQKLRDLADAVFIFLVIGGLGRAARWARKERMGPRRWSWRVLCWELVLTLFSGFVGGGLAEAIELGQKAEWATIALLSYFGPEFIEDLVLRFRDQRLPRDQALDPATGKEGN